MKSDMGTQLSPNVSARKDARVLAPEVRAPRPTVSARSAMRDIEPPSPDETKRSKARPRGFRAEPLESRTLFAGSVVINEIHHDPYVPASAGALAPVTVQAGRWSAGDEPGATLTTLEVVSTPGAAANVNRAIQTLPGAQTVDGPKVTWKVGAWGKPRAASKGLGRATALSMVRPSTSAS